MGESMHWTSTLQFSQRGSHIWSNVNCQSRAKCIVNADAMRMQLNCNGSSKTGVPGWLVNGGPPVSVQNSDHCQARTQSLKILIKSNVTISEMQRCPVDTVGWMRKLELADVACCCPDKSTKCCSPHRIGTSCHTRVWNLPHTGGMKTLKNCIWEERKCEVSRTRSLCSVTF